VPDTSGTFESSAIAPEARQLAARYHFLWSDGEARAEVTDIARSTNPEWDFMGRTFLVLALAEIARRDPEHAERHLALIDRAVDDTLRVEAESGYEHFLLRYGHGRPFAQKPSRSLFVDGEIALMLGARRMIAPDERLAELHRERVERIVERMEASPVLCCESYPDECWMFCNAAALASVSLSDRLDGTDHGEFFARWVDAAKEHLLHPATGLLVSSFGYDGRHLDGPEGSSIWFAAHCLRLVDEDFARDQYERARREIGRTVLGFGYAREWPESWVGPTDVDSGPIVPVVEASAGSSGLALVAASSFGDREYYGALRATLDFAAFPTEEDERLRYRASNIVGDAVLLYSMVAGPLWSEVVAGGTSP